MKLPIICERLGDDVLRLGVGAVDFTQPSYGFLPQEAAERTDLNAQPVCRMGDLAVCLEDGRLTVTRGSRTLTLSGFPQTPNEDEGYALQFRVHLDKGEAGYGLGQHQNGLMDQSGHAIDIWHNYRGWGGEVVGIPFLVSSHGYGLVLDNTSRTTLTPAEDDQDMLWDIEVADGLKLYLLLPDDFDGLYQAYYRLTGAPPLPPKYALAYIQCKQRYRSREELMQVARTYREKGYPCDLLIIDWFHWKHLGDMAVDEAYWPDPEGMCRELEEMGFKVMISCWPRFMKDSQHYDTAEVRGWFMKQADGQTLYGTPDDQRGAVLDTINPECGAWFWDIIREGYATRGFTSWWLDECEPDIIPYDYFFSEGSGRKLYNLYPFTHQQAVYEGHRRDLPERGFILARCAYHGSQRFGTTYWASDIAPTWDVLKRQVPCGINFCASGMPYWSSDIGGWMPMKDHYAGFPYYFEDYIELYIRWFQYGAFCPTFRAHGTRDENEVWSYGPVAEPILVKYLHLRYRLMSYIYALSYKNHTQGSAIMRGLFMDFAGDPHVLDLKDEYLFGPSLLVAPITTQGATSRQVYLPAGSVWYDFETSKRYEGGHSYDIEAPLEKLPLFVRGGSILPLCNVVPNMTQRPTHLELRAYAGADADFTLYEDDNLTYAYEEGAFATLPVHYEDCARRLVYDEAALRAYYPDITETFIG